MLLQSLSGGFRIRCFVTWLLLCCLSPALVKSWPTVVALHGMFYVSDMAASFDVDSEGLALITTNTSVATFAATPGLLRTGASL